MPTWKTSFSQVETQ